MGGVQQSFQPVRHAHSADVAHQELPLRAECLPQGVVDSGRSRRKEIGFDPIFDDGNFLRRNSPALHQMLLERRSHHDDAVGTLVQKLRHCSQRMMQQRIFIARADSD